MQHDWSAIGPGAEENEVVLWRIALEQLQSAQATLEREGRWRSPPNDLLTICGMHRRELAHSFALAWLCDSDGDHGLGTTFAGRIRRLANAPNESLRATRSSAEVIRDKSRADVVVRGSDWTLVV